MLFVGSRTFYRANFETKQWLLVFMDKLIELILVKKMLEFVEFQENVECLK